MPHSIRPFRIDQRPDNEIRNKTFIELLVAAFGSRTAVWVRRRTRNVTSSFKSTFRHTSAGPEHFKQLAIQHDVHGPGDASPYDCREYQCVRQFGKRRGACQRFELF